MNDVQTYAASLDGPLKAVAERLEALLDAGLPAAEGKLWHGHPVWMEDKEPIAGFKAFPRYVTLMVWQGQTLQDPSGALTPSGSAQMATVKLSSTADLDEDAVTAWLAQLAG
ncbi:DUF1801 domain-containing protein [Arthrobacter sp. 35W]|uniref:DUF1801 domain-containing protein n=1 Tax=Arthrobacter sp. 35W TaxID=1132441 RepID=UPI0003FF559C|nr:DUF1801 domain-containing protein [Arthrobacter sp. 35W]